MKNLEKCVGCGACANVCPINCIEMINDEMGFIKPKIDYLKCIDCNKCRSVCQINKTHKFSTPINFYAVKNKDEYIRENSSSGGFFSLIASDIIDGGGVVVGASYDKSNKVIHKCIKNVDDLSNLRTSKYIQSDIYHIYKEIVYLLEKNITVLFSGTPCQCNALKRFLSDKRVDNNNLILCDTLCHGIPGKLHFEKYLKHIEKAYEGKIEKINFRYKNRYSTQNLKISLTNGNEYFTLPRDDPYFYAFLKGYGLLNKCYECEFSRVDRVSDISMGDYWGIDNYYPKFNDKNGVSLILINTKKGEKTFERVKNKTMYININREECLQPSLIGPVIIPKSEADFEKILLESDYKEIIKFLEVAKNDKKNQI